MRAMVVLTTLVVLSSAGWGQSGRVLRICADPNNMPFSNRAGEGFENRLAELVAREIGATVEYTWWPQRRGFVRHTLNAHKCDVVMGVPADFELVLTTRAYYRSSYVFVTRKEQKLGLRSLDDPKLRALRIGVHVVGDDYASLPPVHALARRGIIENVVGYSIYGDYQEQSPPARLLEAVARGELDVALAWGPLAGFHARRDVGLEIAPITSAHAADPAFAFDIAMGVRRQDVPLKHELERVLDRRDSAVRALMRRYGVPLLGAM